MMSIIGLSFLAILFLSLLVFMTSFFVGQYIHNQTLNNPEIPFLNNRGNALWMQHQPPRQSFRFLVLGDIQCGHSNLSRHIFQVTRGNYSFAIQTGDLMIHADEGHYALTLHELQKSNLNVPLFVVPGNHDVNGSNPGLFDKYFTLRKFYFFWSGCLFVILDTSSSPPYSEQFRWLEKVLEENQTKASRTFIFMHRGPEGPVGCGEKRQRSIQKDFAPFLHVLKRFHIDYVFSGHVHDYCRSNVNGTTYIANGAESDLEGVRVMPSYITVVEVTPEKVSDQRVTIQASLFESICGKTLDNMVAHIYPRLMSFGGRKRPAEKI